MKRNHLLLLILPLVVGALYLRLLASWRPKRVFQSEVRVGLTTRIGPVSQFVFSPDGRILFVGTGSTQTGQDNTAPFTALYALDTKDGFAPRWQWKVGPGTLRLGRRLHYYPRTSSVLLDGTVQLWDANTGQILTDYSNSKIEALSGVGVYSELWLGTISPDGKWLVGGPGDKQVALYRNLSPGHRISHFSPSKQRQFPEGGAPNEETLKYAFSPDGKILAVGVGDAQGVHLDFYDTNTWKRGDTWTERKMPATGEKAPSPYYYMLQWSRNGRFLLSWWHWEKSRKQHMMGLTLWRANDGQKLAFLQAQLTSWGNSWRETHYEVEDDGRVLRWTDSPPSIHLSKGQNFNFESKPLLTLPKESISAATLSPDGSFLVAGTISSRVYTQRLK